MGIMGETDDAVWKIVIVIFLVGWVVGFGEGLNLAVGKI
jgi:hypothetical protein